MTETHVLPLPTHAAWHDETKVVKLSTGIQMAYMEAGNPAAPPLMMIHGFSDSSRVWRKAMESLQDAFHIYAIDLRGLGQSDKPRQYVYTMAQHTEDILAFMDAMKIPAAYFIGHSMGSMIVQTVAFSAPSRVTKLVLASTMTRMHESPADLQEIDDQYLNLDLQNTPADELQQMFLPYPEKCADTEFPAGYLSTLRFLNGPSLAASWRGMSLTDNRNFLQFIKAPVLILWGMLDEIFTQEHQDEVKACLPDAQFISFDNLAHEIPTEIPEKMADLAREFFLG